MPRHETGSGTRGGGGPPSRSSDQRTPELAGRALVPKATAFLVAMTRVAERSRVKLTAARFFFPSFGLGEIGRNLRRRRFDWRIVVVDVVLRFPTPEMVGIDLSCWPDFSYLREPGEGIRG